VTESFGVDPTLDIALSSAVMKGDLIYAGAEGWSCSEDGDCWFFDEGTEDGQPAPFVLPSAEQALNNCWPLLAMWPVLYAFYQGELALGLDV